MFRIDRCQRRRRALRVEPLESRRLLATLLVTSTIDAVDTNPGDGICEIGPGGPCTLRAAIQEANALVNRPNQSDVIIIPSGIYRFALDGRFEQDAATGDLDITDDVILRGTEATDSVIHANRIDRVFDIPRGRVTIEKLTIRGGSMIDSEDPLEGLGGGIRNEGELELIDSIVSGNVASSGAGIANYNGTLQIRRSVITGNGSDQTSTGGGLVNYSSYDPATLDIVETTIADNRADRGGGISNRSYDGTAFAQIDASTISNNTADVGAGIDNHSVFAFEPSVVANVVIRNSTVSGNVATSSGGGLRNDASENSTSSATVLNSTIANNTASTGDGGGILNLPNASLLTLTSSLIADNSAGQVGDDVRSEIVDAIFTLIEDSAGHPVINGTENNIVGQDPSLSPLADNGGLTRTHLLNAGSIAIDAGRNTSGLASDQRGSAFARTIDDPLIVNSGDGTDIGAVEVGQEASDEDFGDAPDQIEVGGILRRYPTRRINDGARHQVTPGGPHLGLIAPDPEPDGQSTANADGDQQLGIADEDGIPLAPITLLPGQPLSSLQLAVDGGQQGARLNVWIDFNLDGDWDDPGEYVVVNADVPAGPSNRTLGPSEVPLNAAAGVSFLRARISSEVLTSPGGAASDGEVEDYQVILGSPTQQVADLSLTASADPRHPEIGERVSFTVILNNAGPDPATNVVVDSPVPGGSVFANASVQRGNYDPVSGTWNVGTIAPGESVSLILTTTVTGSDSINLVAEVTNSDQSDPDSLPGNSVEGEDDLARTTARDCLTADPIGIGTNRIVFRCATPGSLVVLVQGSRRGSHTFDQYSTTVNIDDAREAALAIADPQGIAVSFLPVTPQDLARTIIVQAFEIGPQQIISNTLPLEVAENSSQIRVGGLVLDVNGDQQITALDALIVIGRLDPIASEAENQFPSNRIPDAMLDTNGDGHITPLDALLIIHHIANPTTMPEPERSSRTALMLADGIQTLSDRSQRAADRKFMFGIQNVAQLF